MVYDMKGITPELYCTAIIGIFVVLSVLGFLVLLLVQFITGEYPMSHRIEFVDLTSKPYMLSGAISDFRIGDRAVIEHALESSFVGSLEGSDSDYIQEPLEYFIEKYYFGYGIEILSDNEPIMQSLNIRALDVAGRCGDEIGDDGKPVGICITKGWQSYAGNCNVGRLEIDQGENKCVSDIADVYIRFACCKAVSIDEWNNYMDENPDENNMDLYAVPCDNDGVCSSDYMLQGTSTVLEDCGPGRIKSNNAESCIDVNSGWTPMCCKDITQETLVIYGFHTEAYTPLFYKGDVNYISVSVDA